MSKISYDNMKGSVLDANIKRSKHVALVKDHDHIPKSLHSKKFGQFDYID